MPKMKNVSVEDLKEVDDLANDLLHRLHDVNDRMDKGYRDEVDNPAELARTFLALSAAATRTAQLFMVKLALDEQKRALEAELRERTKP